MLDDLLFRCLLYIEILWLAVDDALFACIVDMPSLLSLGSIKFDVGIIIEHIMHPIMA